MAGGNTAVVAGPAVVPSAAGRDPVATLVAVIMVVVVGLTFAFGFGNVFQLGLRLGVPIWVAPLVAPAVDLSVVGLLLGTRQLAVQGAPPELLHPAQRLLIFSSVVTLTLNVAEPVIAGDYGKAAFDAVGPALLIGWSEVGPGLLRAMRHPTTFHPVVLPPRRPRPASRHRRGNGGHHRVGANQRREPPGRGGGRSGAARSRPAEHCGTRRLATGARAARGRPLLGRAPPSNLLGRAAQTTQGRLEAGAGPGCAATHRGIPGAGRTRSQRRRIRGRHGRDRAGS